MAIIARTGLAGAAQPLRRYLRTPILAPIAVAIFVLAAWIKGGHDTKYLIALGLTGIGPGAIAALSGMGIIVTYRATGVFNFAQGTIATLVAYLYWEMADQHGWP